MKTAITIDVQISTKSGGLVTPEPLPQQRVDVGLGALKAALLKKGGVVHHHEPRPSLPFEGGAGLFFRAVRNCFAAHYPLALRPEVLMYLVVHELSICVNQNPGRYRHLFTRSLEKERLVVEMDPRAAPDWDRAILDLGAELRARMPPGMLDHLLPPFSTHDAQSRVASVVAVMDAAKSYYDYHAIYLCGIPRIRLHGEGADYDRLMHACAALSEVFARHLGGWFQRLLPVLREIADTANGRKAPDNTFWSSIFQEYSSCGNVEISGWLGAFLAYDDEFRRLPEGGPDRWIDLKSLPNHLSTAPLTLHTLDQSHPLLLVGGILAVLDDDGFVMPVLGTAVVSAPPPPKLPPRADAEGDGWLPDEPPPPALSQVHRRRLEYAEGAIFGLDHPRYLVRRLLLGGIEPEVVLMLVDTLVSRRDASDEPPPAATPEEVDGARADVLRWLEKFS